MLLVLIDSKLTLWPLVRRIAIVYKAEILGILWVDRVQPRSCGSGVDLTSSCIFARATAAGAAIILVLQRKCVRIAQTYMTRCLLDVIIVVMVNLFETRPPLLFVAIVLVLL